jgi:succinate dehydrogenase / fumarate reductase membrane anchor subunit
MQRVIETVTVQPQQVRVTPNQGTLPWLLQRFTSYGLVVFLAVHMWFNHFADLRTGNRLTFEIVNRRFEVFPVLYAINDIGLLAFALFHGLNGVRNVVYDLSTSLVLRRTVTLVLLIVGAVALFDGSLTLLALMQLPTTAAR